jgi:hypothetical protein
MTREDWGASHFRRICRKTDGLEALRRRASACLARVSAVPKNRSANFRMHPYGCSYNFVSLLYNFNVIHDLLDFDRNQVSQLRDYV